MLERWRLGPPQFRESRFLRGTLVRISEDARRCVVFLGVEDDTPNSSGIRCVGTGFFVSYGGTYRYLVTVKHVANSLVDAPFLIRINDINGAGSSNISVDTGDLRWFTHEDPDVDLAIASVEFDFRAGGSDVRFIS